MKKLTGLFLGALLLVPSLSFAQATTSTSTLTWSQKQSLIAILYQEVQLLEQQIAQIIAQQTIILQNQQTPANNQPAQNTNVTSSSAAGPATTTQTVSLAYPTPDIIGFTNNNLVIGANAFSSSPTTLGTFTLGYSIPWRSSPIFTVIGPTTNPNFLTIEDHADQGQNYVRTLCYPNLCLIYSPTSGVPDMFSVGLTYVPPAGTYTITMNLGLINQSDGQEIVVSPMTFTLQVTPVPAPSQDTQQGCIDRTYAYEQTQGLDNSQAMVKAINSCPNN